MTNAEWLMTNRNATTRCFRHSGFVIPSSFIIRPSSFTAMSLSLKPPIPPMEARSVNEIPFGKDWQYEPKWDGFRCIAFRDGAKVFLQSKAGQPLARYFPDVVEQLQRIAAKRFVVDGELAIPVGGALSFDELQLRLHPAASRVQKLAAAHPALLIV